METIDLKAYTRRAKELEAAIYMQKRLMEEHEDLIKKQCPVAPRKKELVEPVEPNKEDYAVKEPNNAIWIGIILMLFCGACSLFLLSMGEVGLLELICLCFGILGIITMYNEIKSRKELHAQKKARVELYEHDMALYPQLKEEYEKKLAEAEAQYQEDMIVYDGEIKQYHLESQEMKQKHNAALSVLEKALKSLYDENIIFSKYRNFVAITGINEYLMSGRCYDLEGPDGAYNLYEMELRQNVIINHLSDIINNLEQIRSNQFSLYEEITKANAQVNEIISELRDLKKETKLISHFAEITAVATRSTAIRQAITSWID